MICVTDSPPVLYIYNWFWCCTVTFLPGCTVAGIKSGWFCCLGCILYMGSGWVTHTLHQNMNAVIKQWCCIVADCTHCHPVLSYRSHCQVYQNRKGQSYELVSLSYYEYYTIFLRLLSSFQTVPAVLFINCSQVSWHCVGVSDLSYCISTTSPSSDIFDTFFHVPNLLQIISTVCITGHIRLTHCIA